MKPPIKRITTEQRTSNTSNSASSISTQVGRGPRPLLSAFEACPRRCSTTQRLKIAQPGLQAVAEDSHSMGRLGPRPIVPSGEHTRQGPGDQDCRRELDSKHDSHHKWSELRQKLVDGWYMRVQTMAVCQRPCADLRTCAWLHGCRRLRRNRLH